MSAPSFPLLRCTLTMLLGSVYASSYDCTVRALDFEVGVWKEVIDVDIQAARIDGEGEALVSAFEITQDGNQIWRK